MKNEKFEDIQISPSSVILKKSRGGKNRSTAAPQNSSTIIFSPRTRPSWNEYFMGITFEVAKRSTCLRRQTGAILVKEKRILATGYNGAPSGLAHCLDVGCLREREGIRQGERHELCRGLHAEQNVLLQAALHGIKIKGAALYTTHQPCILCAKMLINGGVSKIFYAYPYPDSLGKEILNEAGVEMIHFGKL